MTAILHKNGRTRYLFSTVSKSSVVTYKKVVTSTVNGTETIIGRMVDDREVLTVKFESRKPTIAGSNGKLVTLGSVGVALAEAYDYLLYVEGEYAYDCEKAEEIDAIGLSPEEGGNWTYPEPPAVLERNEWLMGEMTMILHGMPPEDLSTVDMNYREHWYGF